MNIKNQLVSQLHNVYLRMKVFNAQDISYSYGIFTIKMEFL